MRKDSCFLFTILLVFLFCIACTSPRTSTRQLYTYAPDDKQLFDTIVSLDSLFFYYYNTCNVNLERHAAFYSDTLEFYHDQGGVTYSKKEVLDGIQRNVCGKVTRELVPNSIEVYPIKGYGAVELGLHKFRNNANTPGTVPQIARFIIVWQHKNNEWKVARVISLH